MTSIALALTLSGCLQQGQPQADATNEVGDAVDALTKSDTTLVEMSGGVGVAFDLLCMSGGATVLPRIKGAYVSPEHTAIDVFVHSPPTSTGTQIGYQLDDGEVSWLPVVFADDATQRIEVGPASAEGDAARWTFYLTQDIEPAPRGCYTGAAVQQPAVKIVAVAD